MTPPWVSWNAKSECGHPVELEMSEFSEEHYSWCGILHSKKY